MRNLKLGGGERPFVRRRGVGALLPSLRLLLAASFLLLGSSAPPVLAESSAEECSAEDGTCGGEDNGGGGGRRRRRDLFFASAVDDDDDDDPDCTDDHEKCGEWAGTGECLNNPRFMFADCRRSCSVCGYDSIEDEVLEDEALCSNNHFKCEQWAERGECASNPTYMLKACRNVCGSCPVNVTKDTDFGEEQRIEGNEAPLTSAVVRLSVPYMRSVRTALEYASVREGCTNKHMDCSLWAVLGECQENPGYMQINCGPACQSCEQIDIKRRCPLNPLAPEALKPGDLNRMFERIADGGSEDVASTEYGVEVHSRPRKEGDGPDVEDGPWVVTLDGFITEEECDKMVWFGHQGGYERSQDVGRMLPDGTHDGVVSDSRTSLNAWCNATCKEDPIVAKVLQRIADVTGTPPENSEDLQLLEYSVGQYYVQHHDYIGYQNERPCGVRILTLFLYLNDVEEGGGTRFPDLDITVMPKKGKALLWSSVLDEDPSAKDPRTDHEALPVEKGIKYGANAWIHLRDFQSALRGGCHN